MPFCIQCQRELPLNDEARYDVLSPGADLERPDLLGPYCASCFADTATGVHIAQHAPEGAIPSPEPIDTDPGD